MVEWAAAPVRANRAVQVPRGGGAGGNTAVLLGAGRFGRIRDVATGVINRRKPADLNTVGQRRRGLILSIAVVVGNRHARFNLGGVAEKIFRRLAFAGDIIVITGAASVRVGGTT